MKNGNYTIFCRKEEDQERMDSLLVETESKETAKKAIKWAKSKGLIITRIYKPDTEIGKPDFIGAINI